MTFRYMQIAATLLLFAASAFGEPDPANPSAATVDLQNSLDPHSIAFLPLEIREDVDARNLRLAAEFYEQLVARVAEIPGLTVVDSRSVAPYRDSPLLGTEIAEQLGVASFATVSLTRRESRTALETTVRRVRPGGSFHSHIWLDGDLDIGDKAAGVAENVNYIIFPERRPDTRATTKAATAIVLDYERSDYDRMRALRDIAKFRLGGDPPRYMERDARALSGEVAIAAAQLATESVYPDVRQGVWRKMAGVADPSLIEPLLHALTADEEARVRAQAAKTLIDFNADARVRESLQLAAETDSDELVRQASRWSLMSDEQRWDARRDVALKKSLSEHDRRMAVHRLKNSHYARPMQIDDELRQSLVEFAQNANDTRTRSYLWWALANMCGNEIVPPMLTALVDEPHEQVRETLVSMMANAFPQEPGVYDAIVNARDNDESPLVRKKADQLISRFQD